MQARGFAVRFDRVPGIGHSGRLVTRFLADVVAAAATARAPVAPPHVTYRSVRPVDTGAYGIRLVRASARGDAFIDVEREGDAIHVRRAEGVRSIRLARGALGADADARTSIVDDTHSVDARWEASP
jgi:hypothetical protein